MFYYFLAANNYACKQFQLDEKQVCIDNNNVGVNYYKQRKKHYTFIAREVLQ